MVKALLLGFGLMHIVFFLNSFLSPYSVRLGLLNQRFWQRDASHAELLEESTMVMRQYLLFITLYVLVMVYGAYEESYFLMISSGVQIVFTILDMIEAKDRYELYLEGTEFPLMEKYVVKDKINTFVNLIYVIAIFSTLFF